MTERKSVHFLEGPGVHECTIKGVPKVYRIDRPTVESVAMKQIQHEPASTLLITKLLVFEGDYYSVDTHVVVETFSTLIL